MASITYYGGTTDGWKGEGVPKEESGILVKAEGADHGKCVPEKKASLRKASE